MRPQVIHMHVQFFSPLTVMDHVSSLSDCLQNNMGPSPFEAPFHRDEVLRIRYYFPHHSDLIMNRSIFPQVNAVPNLEVDRLTPFDNSITFRHGLLFIPR